MRVRIDELMDSWEAAWSSKDPEPRSRKSCTPDVHYEDPAALGADSRDPAEAQGGHAARMWAAFPDARVERTGERLTRGDYVAAPAKLLATHKRGARGAAGDQPLPRRALHLLLRLQDDRLLRVRAFFDLYDAAVQLGVLPGQGTLGEKALLVLRGFGLRSARG